MTQKAAGYLRLSLLKDETTSPERQQEAIARAIAQRSDILEAAGEKPVSYDDRSWEEGGDLFIDLDRSAYSTTVTRPAYEALWSRRHDYSVIAVWEVSRWQRRLYRFVESAAELERDGIDLISASQPEISTKSAMGKLLLTLYAGFAEVESEQLGRRVKGAQAVLLQNGAFRGGTVPVGYRLPTPAEAARKGDKHTRLVLCEDEAAILRRGAELVLAGSGWNGAARALNEEGRPTRKGTPWRGSNLAKLLTSPAAAGLTVWEGTLLRDADGTRVSFTVEPVLDEATWQKLRAMRSPRQGGPRRETLLAGLVRCATCGARMRGSGSTYPTYACPRGGDGSGACDAPAIVARGRLDPYIQVYALARLTPEALAEVEIERPTEAAAAEAAMQTVSSLDAALTTLEQDRAAGVYDAAPDRWRAQYEAMAAKLAEAREQLEATEALASRPVSSLKPIAEEEWSTLSNDQKRHILEALIERIEIERAGQGKRFDPARVTVVPK